MGWHLSSPGHVPSSSGSHVIGGEATQALAPLRIQSHLLSTHSLFTPKEGEKVTVEHLQISVPKLSEPFHSFIHVVYRETVCHWNLKLQQDQPEVSFCNDSLLTTIHRDRLIRDDRRITSLSAWYDGFAAAVVIIVGGREVTVIVIMLAVIIYLSIW